MPHFYLNFQELSPSHSHREDSRYRLSWPVAPEAGPEPEEEAASGQKQASESTIMPDRNRPQISSARVSQGVGRKEGESGQSQSPSPSADEQTDAMSPEYSRIKSEIKFGNHAS